MADQHTRHPGGGFNPPEPTARGGPDYGRFIEAMRALQDHARAVDAPDEVITEAADALQRVRELLARYDTDEWSAPSGRRLDLPMRGNLLTVPMQLEKVPADGLDGPDGPDGPEGPDGQRARLRGWARFPRFYLGRNGAVHGGAVALLFDSVLGTASWLLTGGPYQRTAYLHVDYRSIVPIEKELQVEAAVDRVEGRKIFVAGRLYDGDTLLTEAEGLFVLLKPGQP